MSTDRQLQPQQCGDVWVGARDGRWYVGHSQEDVEPGGTYSIADWPSEETAWAYACGYMNGATP